MIEATAKARPKMASMSAVVTGPCRHCGLPLPRWPERPDCDHEPDRLEDLGVVAYWHRNPLMRLRYRLGRRLRRLPAGTITKGEREQAAL